MIFFGWRFTRKPPHVESDEIKALHKLLKNEKAERASQAKKAAKNAKALKLELEKAKLKEQQRLSIQREDNKQQAINHLQAAERYFEQMEQAKGARVSQLKAIVDTRLEQAENLGFKLNGSITKTIQGLL